MTKVTGLTPFDNGTPTAGGSATSLKPGDFFQPTGVMSDAAFTTPMQAATVESSGVVVRRPGHSVLVDPTKKLQKWIAVGASLTGGSCYNLQVRMSAAQRKAYLTDLIVNKGWKLFRVAYTGNDFDYQAYWTPWDSGTFDPTNFMEYIVPTLLDILAIDPTVQFLWSPWTPPAALKTTGSLVGGYFSSSTANQTTYAGYISAFVTWADSLGIPVNYLTIQNEPQVDSASYPCCWMSSADQIAIGKILKANWATQTFQTGVTPKLIAADTSYFVAIHLSVNSVFSDYIGDCLAAGWDGYGVHNYSGYPAQMDATLAALTTPPGVVLGTEWMMAEPSGSVTLDSQVRSLAGQYFKDMMNRGLNGLMMWNLILDTADNGPANGQITNDPTWAGWWGACTHVDATTGNVTYAPDYYILNHINRTFGPGGTRLQCSPAFTTGSGAADLVVEAGLYADGATRGVFLWNPTTTAMTVTVIDGETATGYPVSLPANSFGSFTWSAGDVVLTGTTFTAPGAVTSLTGTSANGVNTIKWAAPTAVGDTEIGGYIVLRGGVPIRQVSASTLTFSETYGTATYSIVPYNAGGISTATAPTVNVTGTTAGATSYTLTGSTSLLQGQSSPYVITPNGVVSTAVTVTLASTLAGSFDEATVTLPAGSSAAVTVNFTPSASGTGSISASSGGALTDPAAISVTAAAATTTYSVTGPSALTVGTAATFTVTQGSGTLVSDTIITPALTGITGTISPTTVSFSGGTGQTATFTVTPTATGTGTMSFTNSRSLTDPSALALTVSAEAVPFSNYTLGLSPASVSAGGRSTVTATPGSGAANTAAIVVTLSDGGAGGSFSPATVTFAAGSTAAVTSTYTAPTTAQTVSISGTNNGSLSNPASASLTVTDAVANTVLAVTGTSGATLCGTAASNNFPSTTGIVGASAVIGISAPSQVTANVFIAGIGWASDANHENSPAADTLCSLWLGAGGTTGIPLGMFWTAANGASNYIWPKTVAPITNGKLAVALFVNTNTTAGTDGFGNAIAASTINHYNSTDGGSTWTLVETGTPGNSNTGINPTPKGQGVLAYNFGTGSMNLYKATVYDGSTKLIDVDMSTATVGASTFTDKTNNVWTVGSPNVAIAAAS
ncbi:hypothetical protein GOB93_03380 [Acetobacter musti]|uniref:Glycosyl hydrolase family 30 TIM-barrel domain-containing protein n=1 Tax=Acetobacter musti TaxID=864732 RepID=A0ABX0JLI4_9PROT|nr:hypothetical protein [Acetobacter musti]NHN83682.1 hypothetical protein [Acetobacter musti]